jgi:4-hydroxybenzoate polyprenyltransferase
MAPIAGWLAVTPAFDWIPVILGAGVLFWVAGFDIIYACQDIDFDREANLHSLPVWLGASRALRLAALAHVLAFGFFVLTGIAAGLGWPFYFLSLVTAGLLIWEHRLVQPGDLKHLDLAFFKVNSLVSLALLLSVSLGLL